MDSEHQSKKSPSEGHLWSKLTEAHVILIVLKLKDLSQLFLSPSSSVFRSPSLQMRTSSSPAPWRTSCPQPLPLQNPQNRLTRPSISLKHPWSCRSTSTPSQLPIPSPWRQWRSTRGGRPSSSRASPSTTRSPGRPVIT